MIILKDGNQRATDGDTRAVERVDKTIVLLACLVPGVEAPGLKITTVRAGRDFAICALPGQPHFEIVRLVGLKAHVPRAEKHPAKGQVKPVEDGFGCLRHAFMLVSGLVRRGDRDELDLVKLMLADQAARVLACSARFGAETGRERDEAQWELGFAKDFFADEIGERYLSRRDQPAAIGGLEQIVGKFGQLPCADQRVVAHEQWRGDFLITEFGRVNVEHELAQRTR